MAVWASEAVNPTSVPIGRYFRDLLDKLGYRATLQVVGFNQYFSAIYAQPRRAQIAWESWTADYASESGFIAPMFACDGASNDTGFCDPAIDKRMEEATRLRATDPTGASDLWSKIEHDLVDQAPLGPAGDQVLGESRVSATRQLSVQSPVGPAGRPDVGPVGIGMRGSHGGAATMLHPNSKAPHDWSVSPPFRPRSSVDRAPVS